MILSYVIYEYAPENRKDTLTSIVSRDFIYRVLLPPIVLAEGFNIRKGTFGKYGKEITVVGVIVPAISFFAFAGTLYSIVSISDYLPNFAKELNLE